MNGLIQPHVRLSNNFYIGICLIGWLLGSAIPYLNVEKVDLISDALPFGQLWYNNFQPRAREYGRDRFPQLVGSSWFWWPSSLVRTHKLPHQIRLRPQHLREQPPPFPTFAPGSAL